jgi:hypothetical protein
MAENWPAVAAPRAIAFPLVAIAIPEHGQNDFLSRSRQACDTR